MLNGDYLCEIKSVTSKHVATAFVIKKKQNNSGEWYKNIFKTQNILQTTVRSTIKNKKRDRIGPWFGSFTKKLGENVVHRLLAITAAKHAST